MSLVQDYVGLKVVIEIPCACVSIFFKALKDSLIVIREMRNRFLSLKNK